MDRGVSIELAKYGDIHANYHPRVGDVIIRHGWISRVRWFGIINGVDKDGKLTIVTGGMPRMLLQMAQEEIDRNTVSLTVEQITKSFSGTYTAIQQVPPSNVVVWYV